ncbi:metallophosphoesterase [candidate division WOR-3 bacterium]|nr:metallophosphoesterase [Candidatus Parcubacteria bacterium]MCK4526451.1 metallophosphoesterase [candidate division WOR-3 bacterium]
MIKFIHLSDLHIHSTERTDNKNCREVINFILNKYQNEKPIVLITGDITDDGTEQQYFNACTILKPLVREGFKVLPTPGNHDYGFAGNIYTEKSQQLFQDYILDELIRFPEASQHGIKMEDIYPMVTIVNNVIFIGLDSVVGNENEFLHFASGEVGELQRRRLAIILKGNTGKKVVVYFHHHPFYRNSVKKFVMEMDDAKEVFRILAGLVDFVCFGHKHVSDTWLAENNIDWMLASGKTPRRNEQYKFQYREVTINKNSDEVAMITFM